MSTLFLLNAVSADEVTQALIALNLAREAGIERIVYLSVIHSDRYVNVPHFAGKFVVERMIEQMGLNATILRPAYFIDNDLTIKDVVTGYGLYPMPIGSKGLAMVDTRDIAEVAALELLRREQSAVPLPLDRINLVGPNTLTGLDVAAIWTEVLARPIAYPGDDTAGFEQNLRRFMPSWMAFDMRLMSERFLTEGMRPDAGDVVRLTTILSGPCTPTATSPRRSRPRPQQAALIIDHERKSRDGLSGGVPLQGRSMQTSETDTIESAQPKILVLGATGGTGRLIVSQAVARGYDVTVLVRSAREGERSQGSEARRRRRSRRNSLAARRLKAATPSSARWAHRPARSAR